MTIFCLQRGNMVEKEWHSLSQYHYSSLALSTIHAHIYNKCERIQTQPISHNAYQINNNDRPPPPLTTYIQQKRILIHSRGTFTLYNFTCDSVSSSPYKHTPPACPVCMRDWVYYVKLFVSVCKRTSHFNSISQYFSIAAAAATATDTLAVERFLFFLCTYKRYEILFNEILYISLKDVWNGFGRQLFAWHFLLCSPVATSVVIVVTFIVIILNNYPYSVCFFFVCGKTQIYLIVHKYTDARDGHVNMTWVVSGACVCVRFYLYEPYTVCERLTHIWNDCWCWCC